MCAPTVRSRCCRKFEVNDPLLTRRSALRERAQIDPAVERSRAACFAKIAWFRIFCVAARIVRNAGTGVGAVAAPGAFGRCGIVEWAGEEVLAGSCGRVPDHRLDARLPHERACLHSRHRAPERARLHNRHGAPERARADRPCHSCDGRPNRRARARACRPGAAPCCRPACAPCRSCPSVRAVGRRSVLQTRRAAAARHRRRSRTARGARDRAGLQAGSVASGSRHRARSLADDSADQHSPAPPVARSHCGGARR